jgi:hypothetical protein
MIVITMILTKLMTTSSRLDQWAEGPEQTAF